jgi:hypothetical protein
MQLKNLVTASFGVLLSLKAMAYDKELYGTDMTQVESNKKALGNDNYSYKVCTDYRIKEFFAFDATALGSTTDNSAIFGSKMAAEELQSLLDLQVNDTYVFTAALDLSEQDKTAASPIL